MLSSALDDVRSSFRTLRKNPGFTLVTIATLAIGIGVNAAVFTVTSAVLFNGFPHVDKNDRLLYLTTSRYCCVSYPDFEDWRAQAKSFQGMAIVRGVKRVFSDKNGFPENYDATEVSADTFRVVGRHPIIGRDFAPSDETPGAPPVAILSYGFWDRRFGKDPAIVGQTVRMNGAPTTVIGVMPQGFVFPQKQDLWVPLVPTSDDRKLENRDTWFVFGRLADGVTIQNARAEMATIGKRLEMAYPLADQDVLPQVRNFHEFFIGQNETILYAAMWGAVGFVLLIACANLANLMLARAIRRSREISVRIALGAGRWRIFRRLLIESVTLSVLGGVLGWWIAKWGVQAYDAAPSRASWRILDYTMDYRVFGYLIAISVGTGLLFGLAPALRLSKLDVYATLKEFGRSSGGKRAKQLSTLLVIGEMALAVVLLAGAGVMLRSLLNVYNSDAGFETAHLLTMSVDLPVAKYPTAAAQISFANRLTTRLKALAGVESVAIANRLPMGGAMTLPYEVAGAPPASAGDRLPTLSALIIGPDYFRTLGTAVLLGREFNDADGVADTPTALVNQRFASEHWPGKNPLGQHLRLIDRKALQPWLTVVGLVPNIGVTPREVAPLVYLPFRQTTPHSGTVPAAVIYLIARTRVPPGSLGAAFRREVQAIDSDLPIWSLITWPEILRFNHQSTGKNAALFLTFAAIALLLASIGLYAVIAHSVSQQTQEIGIRMAIGASARDIRKLVFMQGMLPLAIGLVIGLAASFAVNRVLESALVRVSPSDPISLVVSSAVLICSAMLGCLIPARRAMRVDPLVALRHE